MVIAVAHLRFPSSGPLDPRGRKRGMHQALPLVPWKHAWAPFLSNVVLVGAYWWSFFTSIWFLTVRWLRAWPKACAI
jgi:hypothetical protein